MPTMKEEVSGFWEYATIDDVTFPSVLDALRELTETPPGQDDTERMLHFVGLMLDQGFIAVSSPYADPPGEPWCDGDRDAVLRRIRQEWEALDHEPTFLDLCWFHRPRENGAKRA
ncbi:hypothetical protein SAMN02745775_11063 [Falsiroseomonas stagni DSM 19981]|uniref:Uncharacterized protein n=2 Tax=Falsiroseomonas TaxID=2870713 RepID=A0A1I4DC19_9PROT|nr:hypothetical protein SAMN02745775_11063 [Falsiroseomonas stagni DSM 19981]